MSAATATRPDSAIGLRLVEAADGARRQLERAGGQGPMITFVDEPRVHQLVCRGTRKAAVSSGFVRADARTRTADPFITSEVLYQLSYVGGAGSSVARCRKLSAVRFAAVISGAGSSSASQA